MRIADKVKLVFFTLLFIPLVATSCCARGSELSTDDMEYLRNLAEDTFRYIDFFIAEETGFPYDFDKPGELTNTTNIGLFLASLGIGYQIGLTDREHAIGRAEKIIYSLQRIQTWNGLYNNLLSTSGKTEIRPGANAISDFNKLVAGLIIVSETFPELKDRAMGLVNRINWSPFYNQGTGSTYTGYDLEKKEMIAWGTPFVGADTLLASFLMIASGQVPPETWKRLDRSTEKRYDFEYYTPGWQGGGLFMQFICGMFLDDRGSDIGYSKANFARAQMVHAQKIGSPVWGWSASAGPRGGYLGWGNIIDSVVTPHASALAINLYPQEVVSNLRMLEKLGARKPYEYQGKMHEFGFRDSIDVCSGDVADGYLILDQAMLFLSLANFLEDGIVWKTFAKSGLVKNGLRLVKDLEVGGTARRKFLEDIQNLKPDKPLVNIGKIGDVCKITPGQSISADIRVINLTAGKWAGLRLESRVYQEGISGPLESDARVFELVDRAEQVIHTVSVPAKATKQATSILIQAWLYDSDGRLIGKDDRTFTVFEGLDLSGEWLFQTGDNTEWAGVNYTDKNWDRIDVPVVWEKQGYANYDGYGWYRKHFSVPDTIKKRWGKRALILRFGAIDDVDETYLNGRLLGITGTFPQKESAHCVTAYDKQREYRIPEGVLNYEKENIIAVRVYDEIGEGGIWKEPVEIVPAEKFQRRKVK